MLDGLHGRVADYYTQTVRRHGATPLGVDWTCRPTQELRFLHLLEIGPIPGTSLDDLGCGYGALAAFLDARGALDAVDYLGIDVSDAMLRRAHARWGRRRGLAFRRGPASPRVADYCVASGIFNVMLDHSRADWEHHIEATLRRMEAATRMGFAFNMLEGSVARTGVYRAEAARWEAFCRDQLGHAVEMRSGYGLREFTVLARRCSGPAGAISNTSSNSPA